ncbi:MAG: aminotransferase class I/II-fold pyridoxal phosphate-dependent enzyme [Planctomycetes bacterium]|nr:aminotransferase class I/II-fold pyridoxal phosphate-dependent enzyme [Planctomycetota bacterium]
MQLMEGKARRPQSGTQVGLKEPLDDLVRVLRRHAAERPDQKAFVHLLNGQSDEAFLTYARFDHRARTIASRLRDMGLAGQRVLLAYPHGLDFVTGFFGCLYAGCTAVPSYPPHRRTADRFRAIVADAGARLVLSTTPVAAQFQAVTTSEYGRAESATPVPWLATDAIPDASADQWEMPDVDLLSPAMLQYTSGSTSRPKGVMVSHTNLIHNTRAIYEAFGIDSDESRTGVSWLPMYHDMGLVGGILEPILAGGTNVLMSPTTFLQQPVAWLAAISKYRAAISGGPNFAYDLCVRKITDEQRATLDLSCWKLAFVGAEPVQADTLERFAAAFAPCGFSPAACYPCYGLAEATLMVAGPRRGGGATIRIFNDTALTDNRVEPVPEGTRKARRLVSCGTPIGDLRVVIADPQTETEVAPGRVGEIWVAGPSIAHGYWHKPELARRVFHARLANTEDRPFLRTGDLGFVFEDQLYVTGRQDDLLIIRGLNHHPQDLEATAHRCHPLLDAGLGAAFAVDDHGSQRLVLVQEVTRNGETKITPALDACRKAVLDEHGVVLHTIVLVRCGTIPKTSSGKVQRRACREAFLAGKLNVLAEYHNEVAKGAGAAAAVSPTGSCSNEGTTHTPPPAQHISQSTVLAAVCQHAIALGGAALSDVTPDTPLTALGLDSLQRVELAAMLEKTFSCRLPDNEFSPMQTLGELAQAVEKHLSHRPKPDAVPGEIPASHHDFVQFPEYAELKRYERMLRAVAGDNPYFRVDEGGVLTGGVTRTQGRELVNFCVYDYVGMARDAAVAAASKAAIDRYGTSAGASRLVSGDKQVHRDLEQAIASFLGTPAAIVFVSGHATNVTTIGHLFGPDDLVVHDALAHNSIIQGVQLSGATRRLFAHNDWRALDALLSEFRHRYRRVLIAIEGVYSMDGDYPDLPRFVELRKKHKALLLVDEAHSLGTMGPTGRGIGEHWGVARTDVDLWMGTLSKSLASCGGYIAGSTELVEYLGYTAPGFVYSVGLSPPNAAAALAALTVLRAQPQRVSKLRGLAALFLTLAKERGLDIGLSDSTPVIPVIVGNSVKSLRLARALFDRGINVQPILHPAVPEHAARLRFFITTNHSETQVRDAVTAIADELAKL